jgi:hypothetical protein
MSLEEILNVILGFLQELFNLILDFVGNLPGGGCGCED